MPREAQMADLVTLNEAKLYLRVDGDDEDDTIALLIAAASDAVRDVEIQLRSEEHTSELQSLMRISYAVFCLKKKIKKIKHTNRKDETITKIHNINNIRI